MTFQRILPKPDDYDEWEDLVEQLLPRVVVSESPESLSQMREYRLKSALALAAAALKAAGKEEIAEGLLDE